MSDLAVELLSLRKASTRILPEAVEMYLEATRALTRSMDEDASAFGTTFADVPSIGRTWREIRDAMVGHLAGTASALTDTAAALDQIVIAYVSSDTGTRDELRGLAEEAGLPPI